MALFKRKENPTEEETIQRAPRYNSIAGVCINGFDGQALLKNISIGGLCMQSKTYAALIPGEKHIMKISPEVSTGRDAFKIEVEVRWVRSEVSRFEAGLLLTKPPNHFPMENQELVKYLDYLSK
jgi:hypothetical protein